MNDETYKGTARLTVAQAIIRFLSNQYTERDGAKCRLITGAFGIFGHGNVAGIGQAILQNEIAPAKGENPVPYIMPRNEQDAIHVAAVFAKTTNRLQTWMATTSVDPDSFDMVTGTALATTDHLPILIFLFGQFATRIPDPILQQFKDPTSLDVTVDDAFRPVSRFFGRTNRPEQLIPSLLADIRVLTDPSETGVITIALPQDVQTEAYDWPVEFFTKRVWHVHRPPVECTALGRAVAKIRAAKRPLIIAGGGTIYSEALGELRTFAATTGIPVADTQTGKGTINCDHPCSVGGVGLTGGDSGNHLAGKADLIIGVDTRYSDFTTASKTQFKNPDVSFVGINITPFDAAKQGVEMVVAGAREALVALTEGLADYRVDKSYTAEVAAKREVWAAKVERCYYMGSTPLSTQTEIFGALNKPMDGEDAVINAASSMPGDLQTLWQAKIPVQYHVEYAFFCMGYEVPTAMGVKLARSQSEVVLIVGNGTYQVLPMELATVVQEGIKVIYVLLRSYSFVSTDALSESRGSQHFGTKYRQHETGSRLESTDTIIGVDITVNIRSWGIDVLEVHTIEEFKEVYKAAVASDRAAIIHTETDLMGPNPPGSSWWDVAISEVSVLESTQRAYKDYQNDRRPQRHYL